MADDDTHVNDKARDEKAAKESHRTTSQEYMHRKLESLMRNY